MNPTTIATWLLGSALLAGCSPEVDKATNATAAASVERAAADPDAINPRLLRRFAPLPVSFDLPGTPRTKAQIDLGRSLFYETRLSMDGDLSCNGCHDLATYGVDHTATSRGFRGQRGSRNAPSVYDAAGAFVQFWDGRAETVEQQAMGPMLNPIEMAMPSADRVVATLSGLPEYRSLFHDAFPDDADPITVANIGKAIGAFERGLVTPGRWDRFLLGERDALTHLEKQGLKTFLDVGCMVCHTGPLVGGSMFERAGAVEPWPNTSDRGRAAITKADADAMMFKVPSLRNVAKTAPYFHDGSAATLDEAVRKMGKHQLGLELSTREVDSIVAWLGALTGEIPSRYIERVATDDTACTGDCPLQRWMKATLLPAMATKDFERLDVAFERLASHGPSGYQAWTKTSADGAAAARAHDFDGVRRACGACHDQNRARYRRESRQHPI